jgi:cell division protein FtsW
MAFVASILRMLAIRPRLRSWGWRARSVLALSDGAGAPSSIAAPPPAWHQSLIALGSGGLVGRGYGAGLQKLFFLPEPHTDFIFAITGEELGLVGVLLLIGLASVIVWRGLRVAFRLQSPGRSLLAFGLAIGFAVQTLIHMVVCLAMLPPKGIPLPLVSYGKTDLVVSLMAVGLLLNLSREVAS